MRFLNQRVDVRVAVLYATFGGLWILFSDRLLAGLVSDIGILSRLQTYKGWAFVTVSALLIFVLLRRELDLRNHAEGDFQKSEKRYRLISEHSADVIWTLNPATGRFTYVSPSVFNLRGLTPEEVMAEPMQAALTPASYQFVVENLPARLTAFEAGDSSARTAITEVDQTRKDGSIVPTEVVTTLITDASGQVVEILGVTREITERKRAEAQIHRQLEHLNSLHLVDLAISSSFDLNVIFDIVLGQLTAHLGVDAAVILLFNPQLHVIEYAASRGLNAESLQHMKSRPGHGHAGRAMLERRIVRGFGPLQNGGEPTTALTAAHKTFADYFGVPLIVKGEAKGVLELYYCSPLQADPEWLQFLETMAGQAAIAIDNAQLFQSLQRANASLERRVVERTAELHQANIALAHANRAKDEFLATMSHELRTPLNSILGLSESLIEQLHGPLNEQQQKYVRTIEASGRHLFELICDILDLSKIEAGRLDYRPQSVPVDELCRSSLAFIHEQAIRRCITITYQNEMSVANVAADPRRLKQILINLLVNAVKFTSDNGHVSLRVETDLEMDRICFTVSDDGIGIAQQDLHRLFQPFVQLDGRLNREYSGTGLGLALVQKLTDLHGGSVDVESAPGRGSRFTINLPLGLETAKQAYTTLLDHEPASASQQTEPVPNPEFSTRGTILIAEDSAANLLVLSDYLVRHGYEILVAHDGADAIRKADTTKPDLILMDMQMPVMDGLEAMARLRKDLRFTSTPIIVLTALAMTGDRERCLEAGATEYLSKPVSLKTLSATIENFLGKA